MDGHAARNLRDGLRLYVRRHARHGRDGRLQPRFERSARARRQQDAALLPYIFVVPEHRARHHLHRAVRHGRRGRGVGDGAFAARLGGALRALRRAEFPRAARARQRLAQVAAALQEPPAARLPDGLSDVGDVRRPARYADGGQRSRRGGGRGLHGCDEGGPAFGARQRRFRRRDSGLRRAELRRGARRAHQGGRARLARAA